MFILLFHRLQLETTMELDKPVKLTSSLAKVLQYFCNGHVEFETWAQLTGHLCLITETGQAVGFAVHEKVLKLDDDNFIISSSTFHITTDDDQNNTNTESDRNIETESVDTTECENECEQNTSVFNDVSAHSEHTLNITNNDNNKQTGDCQNLQFDQTCQSDVTYNNESMNVHVDNVSAITIDESTNGIDFEESDSFEKKNTRQLTTRLKRDAHFVE